MRGDDFEWIDKKNASNLVDHGVTFERARLAFSDPFAIGQIDDRFDYGEERLTVTGMVQGTLLIVAFTWRSERRHIISARRANKHEQNDYFQENAQGLARRH